MADYSDIYPKLGRLLGLSASGMEDSDFDDDIYLAIRGALPPRVLAGATVAQFYATLVGDDKIAFDQAIAYLVAADQRPVLDDERSDSSATMVKLGDQSTSYEKRSLTDLRTNSADWRRRAAELLASLSFAALIARPPALNLYAVNGPTRARQAAWECRE